MKYNDKLRVFLNSVIVTGSTIFDKVVFFFINILVARYLSLDLYGEYITALGYATFFSIFTDLGINQTLTRAVNLDEKNELKYLGNTILLKAFLSLILYLIMAGSLWLTNYSSNTIALTLIFGLVRFGNEYQKSFYSLHEAKENFKVSSISIMLLSVGLLLGTWLVIANQGDYFQLAYLRLFVVALVLFFLIIYTYCFFPWKIDLKLFKPYFKSALPFIFSTINFNILQRSNIIILSLIQGTFYSGIFNNAYIFFTTLMFIPINFNRVLTPYLYKNTKDKNKFQFSFDLFSKVFALGSFYLFLIFFLFSDKIIPLFFGAKYLPAVETLKIISFSFPFLFNMATIIITSLDQQKYNSKIFGVAALVNLASNFILIYFYKTEGAALAVVITFFTIFVLTHLFLGVKKYLSLQKTSFMYLIVILITFSCWAAYQYGFKNFNWGLALFWVTLIYSALVFIFLVKKDDWRIIKETFGKKI